MTCSTPPGDLTRGPSRAWLDDGGARFAAARGGLDHDAAAGVGEDEHGFAPVLGIRGAIDRAAGVQALGRARRWSVDGQVFGEVDQSQA
jgi:hypothetical protein